MYVSGATPPVRYVVRMSAPVSANKQCECVLGLYRLLGPVPFLAFMVGYWGVTGFTMIHKKKAVTRGGPIGRKKKRQEKSRISF